MLKLWKEALRWLSGLFKTKEPFFNKITRVSDLPELVEKRTLYLVGDEDFEWCIVLLCPCGCNEAINLTLLPGTPSWRAVLDGNSLATIHPSVWRTKGCRSHFFIVSLRYAP